jgi:hypothetical protein
MSERPAALAVHGSSTEPLESSAAALERFFRQLEELDFRRWVDSHPGWRQLRRSPDYVAACLALSRALGEGSFRGRAEVLRRTTRLVLLLSTPGRRGTAASPEESLVLRRLIANCAYALLMRGRIRQRDFTVLREPFREFAD